MRRGSWTAFFLIFAIAILAWTPGARAGVIPSLYESWAGNINYVGTGGTLRTEPNTGNACAVTTGPVSASLSGIPAGATITAAYLYWAGSYSPAAGSTRTTPDFDVTFEGNDITADRTFDEYFPGDTTERYFCGFKDVTIIVANKSGGPNGTYTFNNLSVNTANPHCGVATVTSGWTLLVVYEDASEDFRVINLFDGFQIYYGSAITLTPSNFRTPVSPLNGKHGHISWEGDESNSGSYNGYEEDLIFDSNILTDALNPDHNQYNSTINQIGSSTTYGVDFDVYDIDSYLTAGMTSASTEYSSGADMVILTAEILSVTNTPVADLSISVGHSPATWASSSQGDVTFDVTNNGPSDEDAVVTVVYTLPTGITYDSLSGTGWTYAGTVGSDVSFTYDTSGSPLSSGNSLPTLTVTVDVDAAAVPSVVNSATVSSPTFDNHSENNTDSDTVTVALAGPDLSTSTKTVSDVNGPDAEVGDVLRYTISLINTGTSAATGVSVTDDVPALVNSFTVTSIPTGATDASTTTGGANGTGYLNVTGITVAAGTTETVVFEVTVDGAATAGDTISNTASVSGGGDPTPSAPDVIVAEHSIPGSGDKNLYLDDLNTAGILTRTPPSTATTSSLINNTESQIYSLSPATQDTLTLAAGNIPVTLWLAESGRRSNRTVAVTLSYSGGSTGTIGSQSRYITFAADSTPEEQVFTFNLASDLTLNPGTTLNLTVANNTGINGRYIYVVSRSGASYSVVETYANTVINVDEVGFYNDSYANGGAKMNMAMAGQTVYVRATVSDPFGAADITAASFDIFDPTGGTLVSGQSMTQVDASGAVKTYEYPYTFPASPYGIYSAEVTADEGTEGTVSDLGVGSIQVGTLVVELAGFEARRTEGGVLLSWNTAAEPSTAGFHVWRAAYENGPYSRITETVIPSEGGTSFGADYAWLDAFAPEGAAYYKLEDLNPDGSPSDFYGPVLAQDLSSGDDGGLAAPIPLPLDGSKVGAGPELQLSRDGGFGGVLATRWEVSKVGDFSDLVLVAESVEHLAELPVPPLALSPETEYFWRARFVSESGGVSAWSEIQAFTTPESGADLDGDGVPDDQAAEGPAPGVKAVYAASGGRIFALEGLENVVTVEALEAMTPEGDDLPASFPAGLVGFRLAVSTPGAVARVRVHLSAPLAGDARWYKWTPADGWIDYSVNAEIAADRLSVALALEDGGPGDADGVVNGVIVDPSGPGVAVQGTAEVPAAAAVDGSTGSGCFMEALLPQ